MKPILPIFPFSGCWSYVGLPLPLHACTCVREGECSKARWPQGNAVSVVALKAAPRNDHFPSLPGEDATKKKEIKTKHKQRETYPSATSSLGWPKTNHDDWDGVPFPFGGLPHGGRRRSHFFFRQFWDVFRRQTRTHEKEIKHTLGSRGQVGAPWGEGSSLRVTFLAVANIN